MPSREQMIKELEAFHGQSAPAQAGRLSPEMPSREQMIRELEAFHNTPEPSLAKDLTDSTATTIRSALESATMGISEPIYSGVNALTAQAYRAASQGDIGQLAPSKIADAYDEDVAIRRADKERMPYADVGGSIAGAFAPIGPASQVAKGVTALGKDATAAVAASKLGTSKLTNNVVGRSIGKVARGAAEGAAVAVATEKGRQTVEKAYGHMKEGEGATTEELAKGGAKWGAGLAALPIAYQAVKAGGKLGMSVFLGPKVETIDKYMANSEAINKAPTVAAIKEEIDTTVRMLADDVEKGNISHEEAKSVLRAMEERASEVRAQARETFANVKFDAAQQFNEAQRKLDAQFSNEVQKMKAVRPPIDLAGDVMQAQADLKQKVSSGSGEAFEILGQQEGKVAFGPIWKQLDDSIEKLNIGNAPATPQAKAAQDEIRRLKESLGTLPAEMSLQEAKRVVQQLDKAERAIYSSTEFTDDVGQAFKKIRQAIDEKLKDVPGYASKMKEVSEDVGLLNRAKDRFKDQQGTISRINSISGDTAGLDRELLQKLGDRTGKNLTRDIDDLMAAQKVLKNPERMEQLRRSLPGYDDVALAKMWVEHLQNPNSKTSFLEGEFAKSGVGKQVSKAEAGVQRAEKEAAAAKARLEPYRSLSPASTEAQITRLSRAGENPDKAIELRKTIEGLQKEVGSNWTKDIDNRGVLDSFSKGDTNGSRKALAGSAVGSFIGFIFGGGIGAGAGAGVGSAAGLVADKYGPAIAKKILDGLIYARGTSPAKAIQSLNVPPEVKDYLSTQLVRHQAEAARSSRIAQDGEAPTKGPEKWAADGLKKVEAHGAKIDRGPALADPKTKELLIQASDLKPGSKAMDRLVNQINESAAKGGR